MTGKLILIIAGTGQGKSTLLKKITAGKPVIIYDVNGEHNELPYDVTKSRCRFFNDDVNTFIEEVNKKHGGTFCVFEEATGFFNGTTAKKTLKMIVGKRHPEALGGRNIVMIFHAVRTIPPNILAHVNMYFMGYTMESADEVKEKHKELLPLWQAARKLKKYEFKFFDRDKAHDR
jgi:hypothetical protein